MRHSRSRPGFGRRETTEEQVRKYLKPHMAAGRRPPLASVINFRKEKKCSMMGKLCPGLLL